MPLRERLLKAIHNAQAPIFLLQAGNDYSAGPSEVLGPVIRKRSTQPGKAVSAFGADDDHRKGHGSFACWNIGAEIWGPDVMAFIDAVVKGR